MSHGASGVRDRRDILPTRRLVVKWTYGPASCTSLAHIRGDTRHHQTSQGQLRASIRRDGTAGEGTSQHRPTRTLLDMESNKELR